MPHRPAGYSTLLTFLVSWWLPSAGRARSHEGWSPAAGGTPSASTAQARTLRAQQSRCCSEAAAQPRPRARTAAQHCCVPRTGAIPGLQRWIQQGHAHARQTLQRVSYARASGGGADDERARTRQGSCTQGRAEGEPRARGRSVAATQTIGCTLDTAALMHPKPHPRAMQGAGRARRGGWWRRCK